MNKINKETRIPLTSFSKPQIMRRDSGLTSQRARLSMVQRLKDNGITNTLVLDAMAHVPRHLYVSPGLASHAYGEDALPIGNAQTISKPYSVAYMISILLQQQKHSLGKILEIGTGCGYQAHVLSLLANTVYSIERIEALYLQAKRNITRFKISNLRLLWGDGYQGIPASIDAGAAPFDSIILAAACDKVPTALTQQLKTNGCLVAPVGQGQEQTLEIWRKDSSGKLNKYSDKSCYFVPMLPQKT